MSDIAQRISNLIVEKKLNKSALAKIIGYSDVAIGKIINGKAKPKFEMLEALVDAFPDLNPSWLLTGKGEMLNSNKDENIISSEPSVGAVPYWNLYVSAGNSVAEIVGQNKPDGYIKGLPGADIAENVLPVAGASMEPEISSSAIIGVRRINNWETLNTERIYLIITSEDRMIKRIEHDSEDENILWCVSPNYPKFKIYKDDIIEIQRVCFVYNPK